MTRFSLSRAALCRPGLRVGMLLVDSAPGVDDGTSASQSLDGRQHLGIRVCGTFCNIVFVFLSAHFNLNDFCRMHKQFQTLAAALILWGLPVLSVVVKC